MRRQKNAAGPTRLRMEMTKEQNHWQCRDGLALVLVCLVLLLASAGAGAGVYDPLALPAGAPAPVVLDLTVKDAAREREIPIRIYLPGSAGVTSGTAHVAISAAPVVLFSHGLGGSRDNNPYLGRHWAARGYVAVFLQHPGSDTSVWRGKPAAQRMGAMQGAASARNFMLRVKDVPAVLDQLARWNATPGHPLAGRLDMRRVGMSGHSFGAVTTQAVSGQRVAGGLVSFTDPRIRAAIAFSPSAPERGRPERAFGGVAIPWMLMTGTKDVAVIGKADLPSRLAVFPALPPGGKYEVVLYNAEHSAFSDRALPGDREARNPNHHRAILALSTAFWDTYLRGDAAAKAWLDGDGPQSVLEAKDRWERK